MTQRVSQLNGKRCPLESHSISIPAIVSEEFDSFRVLTTPARYVNFGDMGEFEPEVLIHQFSIEEQGYLRS